MKTSEKMQVATFNFFCKEMNRMIAFDMSDNDKQDQMHLAYINFKKQKMFKSPSEWISFFFLGFSLLDNKMTLR